jgi:hypothetical protein
MTKRRAAWAGIATAGLLLTTLVGLWWLHAGRNRINRDNFERIQVGMTAEEVEAMLGADMMPQKVVDEILGTEPAPDGRHGRKAWWLSEDGSIIIVFGPDGTVDDKTFWQMRRPGLLDRVRQWLGMSGTPW